MKKIVIILVVAVAVFLIRTHGKKSEHKIIDIVEINNVKYTSNDLWLYSNAVLWEMEPQDLKNEAVKQKILEDFIEHNLLLQEAKRRNIKYDKDAYNQLFIQLSSEQGSKELKALTGRFSISAENIAKLVEERLMVDTLVRSVISGAGYISEEDLKKYYDSKKYTKNPVGEAHILHIFSTDNDTIHFVAKELAAGIQFSELARKYSESPEKDNGGDLGFIKMKSYPEFFSAAFKLKEGETSQIIKSDYGYHIFKMVQYAQASKNSYKTLKPTLLAELYAEKRQEVIGEFVNAIHSNAKIKYLNHFNLSDIIPQNKQCGSN